MNKLLISTFILFCITCYGYASPYANNYLYETMLDYVENQKKYSDNITNGYVKDNNSDIIVGAFIERAYSVYEKEEEYTPEFMQCGQGCYKISSVTDILNAYHKFFYMFAIAEEINGVLLQNPQVNENIEYILKNKYITYNWISDNKLIINIDDNTIEFVKDSKGVTIKTDMQSLNKYRLN